MQNQLEELRRICLSCQRCSLCQIRNNVVFGVGNPETDIMFIGEAPGENEDLQGEPFVGRAGQLLDKLLSDIGLSRKENIYIANILKCRPPQNRDPEPHEIEKCSEYLEKQIEIISPKIIVLVGRIAAIHFLGADFKMTKQHGNGYYKDGIIYFPVFHPAAVLRNMNLLPGTEDDFRKLSVMMHQLKEGAADE